MDVIQLGLVAGSIALWILVLLLRDRFALPRLERVTVKFTHLLPAILQIILFAYWAIYWEPVRGHLPVLGVQLLIAYAFDFLITWTLRLPYHPTLGPIPIVLSANLFVWFEDGDVLLYALVIAVALSSKALLRRGERHIFNPSVLGVAVVGVLCIVLPQWVRYEDISHDFDRPPHMAEVILLLALIPQVRLRTAPVAAGAALAMFGTMLLGATLTGYKGGPGPFWPPWLLAITLLAGDPATIPSSSLSRLLFGLFLGMAYYAVSRALIFSIGTDFFAKVLPIPIANLLVPSFERAGAALSTRWPALPRAVGNRASIATWVSISVLMLTLERLP